MTRAGSRRRTVAAMALTGSALIGFTGFAAAASDQPKPLFQTAEPLQLTLNGPFGSLRNASKPAAGTLTVAGGAALPVTLISRGITRKLVDICAFPPVRVMFEPSPAEPSPFAGQKRLKLVTHCRNDEAFQQHLLVEYAAHRMYNVLTPISYDVRLARVDYRTEKGKPIIARYGFFIEDTPDIARRNALRHFKTTARVSPTRLSPVDAARFAVFEYMIGNLDWSMIAGPAGAECCHNAKLLEARDGGGTGIGSLVPLPYDYDFSGLVDAPYATPPQGIPMKNVRERRYRGYCRHEREARAEAARFLAKRAELTGVFDQVPDLNPATKRKAIAYLDGFFDQVGSDQGLTKMFATCVG